MPGLWPAQRVFEKVRRLSDLLSGVCFPGQITGSGKIKLVSWFLDAETDNMRSAPRDKKQEARTTGENNGD